MLKDFSKLETFLTVVREKSFSKASKKLGISQPAVTQQIKLLEDYLEAKIVDRKKNGTKLTKEGEAFLKVAHKVERCIINAEKDLMKIIEKNFTLNIGASHTIGGYIIPDFLDEIKDVIRNDVLLKVGGSAKMIELLSEKKIDIALVERPNFNEHIYSREWKQDELLIVGKNIPKILKKENLNDYEWVCGEEVSETRATVREAFGAVGLDCNDLKIQTTLGDPTAVKNSILKSKKNLVSILSKYMVQDEIASGQLTTAKIRGVKLNRPFYIAYLKERKNDAFVLSAVNYLMSKKNI